MSSNEIEEVELTDFNVRELYEKCSLTSGDTGVVPVSPICPLVGRVVVELNPLRLEAHRRQIEALIRMLPEGVHGEGLPARKLGYKPDGSVWCNSQTAVGQLICLGLALGILKYKDRSETRYFNSGIEDARVISSLEVSTSK
jgi:hypothetical protein